MYCNTSEMNLGVINTLLMKNVFKNNEKNEIVNYEKNSKILKGYLSRSERSKQSILILSTMATI